MLELIALSEDLAVSVSVVDAHVVFQVQTRVYGRQRQAFYRRR